MEREKTKTVAVVMCTYNGQEYLREQLDSIFAQTRPADEIIVQDDGSTDDTWDILLDSQRKHEEMKLYRNEGTKGVNSNFFSAMERTTCDFIAIADQDDVWATDKIERQLEAIGDSLVCTGFSQPFSTTGTAFRIDERKPNDSLMRLVYVNCISGHTIMCPKRILDIIPTAVKSSYINSYDLILAMAAAAHESVVWLPQPPIVMHRMHTESYTYAKPTNNNKTATNILSSAIRTLRLYRELRPMMRERMQVHLDYLSQIDTDTTALTNAKKMLRLQAGSGIRNFLRLQWFCMKHCDELFHHKERKTILNRLRGLYFPISCCDYIRYLSRNPRYNK